MVTAQVNKAAQKAIDRGEDFFEKEAYLEAEKWYFKSLKIDSNHALPYLRIGSMAYRNQDWSKAKTYLSRALELDTTKHTLLFNLANISWHQKAYDEVVAYIDEFTKKPVKNKRMLRRSEKLQRDAAFMAAGPPVDTIEITRLSEAINTAAPEYLPSLPAAEDLMIFTRRVHGQEDFYVSRKVDGVWMQAVPISDLNTHENEGAHCLSADGKLLIFTACARRDGLGSCDLYYSVLQGSKWSKPANLGAPVCSKSWDGQPSLSANARQLYFSSERPGGKGGRDLWMTSRTAKGWSKAINLSELNTSFNEEAPFIHYDGNSLYFMSDGHPGFGGTDLFLSKRENYGWAKPVNLGSPINTVNDEGALHIDRLGSIGYFARTDVSATDLQVDIMQFPLPNRIAPRAATYVHLHTIDLITKKPLPAIVEVFDLQTQKTILKTQSAQDGRVFVSLNSGENYGLNVRQSGYAFYSSHIDLTGVSPSLEPTEITAELQPIDIVVDKESPAIVLKNVFFEYAKPTLLPSSSPELLKLVTLLQQQVEISIEIHGHTDNIGSPEDNMSLSTERAKTVYRFLIEQGIEEERLNYQGFGETKPIDTNDTEKGRQNNRRTEFVIR